MLWSLRMRASLLTAAGALLLVTTVAANRGPIRQLTVKPAAEVVPLFDGLDDGRFDLRMSAANAHHANVVVTNTTSEPLTVALPKAAVGQHVLPQFGANNGFFGQGASTTSNFGNSTAGSNSTGVAQSIGGGFQGVGFQQAPGAGNGNGVNVFGNGFPSIPPEMVSDTIKTYGGLATVPAGQSIQLQMRTVCLNHGRPDPMPLMTYRLVPVESYTNDPVLVELLENFHERVPTNTMQAAAWHVANGLSWERLQQLPNRRVPGSLARYFQSREVADARQLVTAATEAATASPPSELVAPAVAKVTRTP